MPSRAGDGGTTTTTVTLHLPVHTGRTGGAWPQETDLLDVLGPVFERFLEKDPWLIETYIPWAPYHPAMQDLKKRVRVVHRGCRAGRDRSGWRGRAVGHGRMA